MRELIEKVAEEINWYAQACPYVDWNVVTQENEDIKNYRREHAREILNLFLEELDKMFADGITQVTFIRARDGKAGVEPCLLIMESEWEAIKSK